MLKSFQPKGGSGMSGTDLDDDEDIVESDIELDESDVVAPDDDPLQKVCNQRHFSVK